MNNLGDWYINAIVQATAPLLKLEQEAYIKKLQAGANGKMTVTCFMNRESRTIEFPKKEYYDEFSYSLDMPRDFASEALTKLDGAIECEKQSEAFLTREKFVITITKEVDLVYFENFDFLLQHKIICENENTVLVLKDCTFNYDVLFENGKVIINRPLYRVSDHAKNCMERYGVVTNCISIYFRNVNDVSLYLKDGKNKSFKGSFSYIFGDNINNLFITGNGSKSAICFPEPTPPNLRHFPITINKIDNLTIKDAESIRLRGYNLLEYGMITILDSKKIYLPPTVNFECLGAINSSIGYNEFGTDNSILWLRDCTLKPYRNGSSICGKNPKYYKKNYGENSEESWIGCNAEIIKNYPMPLKYVKVEKGSMMHGELAEMENEAKELASREVEVPVVQDENLEDYIRLFCANYLQNEDSSEPQITYINHEEEKTLSLNQFIELNENNKILKWNESKDVLSVSENVQLLHLRNVSFRGKEKMMIRCPKETTLILDHCTFDEITEFDQGNIILSSPKYMNLKNWSLFGQVSFYRNNNITLLLNDDLENPKINSYTINDTGANLKVIGNAFNSEILTHDSTIVKSAVLNNANILYFAVDAEEIMMEHSEVTVGENMKFSYLASTHSTINNVVNLGTSSSIGWFGETILNPRSVSGMKVMDEPINHRKYIYSEKIVGKDAPIEEDRFVLQGKEATELTIKIATEPISRNCAITRENINPEFNQVFGLETLERSNKKILK